MIFRSRHHIGKVSRVSSRSVGARYQSRKSRNKQVFGLMRKVTIFFSVLGFVGGLVLAFIVYDISKELPDVDTIQTYIPSETTKIFSADNVILAELHREENRKLVSLENISDTVKRSVIALEDTDFYEHHGLNFKGILRAFIRNVQAGAFVEGGSTLTQQLARNIFLSKHRKIRRKIAEAILAVQIENKYTKDEILEMYLNQVYWGHNAYGIESASQMYFGKKSADLTLAEASMLVGLLKGPELYSPFRSMERAKRRQLEVIGRLRSLDIISKQQAVDLYNQDLVLADRKTFKYKAPYFTSFIVKQLIDMYGEESTYTSGMKVYTTLNYALQEEAKDIVQTFVEKAQKPFWIKGVKYDSLNLTQAAIISIEPSTGYIRTLQGGVDFKENEFNRATQAHRQPGSAFKPFVYLTALDKGFSPGTIIDDAPVTFNTIEGPYAPLNYTLDYSGPIPIRKALEKSVNVVAIKLNDLVGPKNVIKTARSLGIKSDLIPILSLPLGANEVTMLELASAYGILANGGRQVEPTGIIRIEDRDGTTLYEHQIRETVVFNSDPIYALVDMMKGVVKYGTGRNANLPRPIAGKTGTTSDYKDAWFVGFVPQLVTAVWVGNDDNTPMNKMTGGWFPAMMWREYMKSALSDIPMKDFPKARGLITRKINWETGKLATKFSPEDTVSEEKFWRGKEPTEYDTYTDGRNRSPAKSSNEEPILDFFKL